MTAHRRPALVVPSHCVTAFSEKRCSAVATKERRGATTEDLHCTTAGLSNRKGISCQAEQDHICARHSIHSTSRIQIVARNALTLPHTPRHTHTRSDEIVVAAAVVPERDRCKVAKWRHTCSGEIVVAAAVVPERDRYKVTRWRK